jgi:hypothetical protein
MHLLTIYPIQSCNLSCEQCPSKPWLLPVDDERNKLTNKMLFRWLDKFCPPHKWFIELRGGEPSLYPEINELVAGLNQRGYYGLIKTNGILPIPKSDNFRRIAAWHLGIDNPPKHYDSLLILSNPEDKWREKIQYCIDNNIPYKQGTFCYFWGERKGQEVEPVPIRPVHFFQTWTMVFSNATMSYCAERKKIGHSIEKMQKPLMVIPCSTCTNVVGQEIWLTGELKRILKQRERGVMS